MLNHKIRLDCVILLSIAAVGLVGCGSSKVLPETHHEPSVEKWVGKTKQQLVQALGPPTQDLALSTGESTLLWEKKAGCRISFNIDKRGRVDSGHDTCAPGASQAQPKK
jgi:hypothetical protein